MFVPRKSRRIPLLFLTLLCGVLLPAGVAAAAPTPMVDLGQAASYAALSGTSVGNTVSAAGAPHTTLRGDLGVKPNTQPTGFPPGIVTGTTNVGNLAAAQAHGDLVEAYDEVAARTGGDVLPAALAGTTVGPGLHNIAGAASNTTTLTLDAGGDPNAVFVFQVGGALAFAAGSHVVLAGGAQASRVFWQVNGAGAVGANATFAGTLMALAAVGVGNGTVVNGRLFARSGALTLDANDVYGGPPVVTITGGANAITTNTTPTISGTTNITTAPTVTVDGQTFHPVPVNGAWSVTSPLLANGTYPVTASVTDGAGNQASATQQLTVDTILPVVTIAGGAAVTTGDSTPTISGSSDVAPGTIVRVAVDAQALTALVQPGGTWNVTPAALLDGTRTVTAAVTDPAGNVGTADQTLTVDTTPPAVSITGGAAALTNDATPVISGTAAVPAGTTVTVDLADGTLLGQVQAGGTWAVTAPMLADGPHRVVMTVADPAGNSATFTQTLTVDTVAPLVAISGGPTATTTDLSPTITGTCDAVAGTTVTVSIAGQTMTTLVQGNGSWNVTPAVVGKGRWPVTATVPDPAGNVGSARQDLTIGGDGATGLDQTPKTPPTVLVTRVDPVTKAVVAGAVTQKLTGTSLSISTKVTAPASGRVVATATGTLKITGVKKAIALTTVTAKIAAKKTATLTLKPKGSKTAVKAAWKRILAAVKKGTKVTATITVRIVGKTGKPGVVKRTVKLTK